MTLPKITNKQKHILYLLYKFRFLHTQQIKIILNHKNPTRIQMWLKDLKDKGYINSTNNPKTFEDRSKPAIYHLNTPARHIFKNNEDCDLQVLNRIYKEKNRTQTFINHCMAIAGLYIYFLSKKKEREEFNFFTESELYGYDYFPTPRPSVYIATSDNKNTSRYFLDFFDLLTPPSVYRARFKYYLKYAESAEWEEGTGVKDFPSVLFVCPTKKRKNHILYFAKAVFEKAFEEKIDFYVTTQDQLNNIKNVNVWEKAET